MTIEEVMRRRNLTLHDLYMEIETREEYGEFIHMCLFVFSDDEIKAAIDSLERSNRSA